jgi:hypothetical protein
VRGAHPAATAPNRWPGFEPRRRGLTRDPPKVLTFVCYEPGPSPTTDAFTTMYIAGVEVSYVFFQSRRNIFRTRTDKAKLVCCKLLLRRRCM